MYLVVIDLSRSLNCSQIRYAPCLNVAGAPRKRRASNCKQKNATIKQQQAAICLINPFPTADYGRVRSDKRKCSQPSVCLSGPGRCRAKAGPT